MKTTTSLTVITLLFIHSISAQNVGIGTTTPEKKLDVQGIGGLKVNSTNTGSGTIDWISGNFGGTTGDRVVMGLLHGNATIGAHNNALNAWAKLYINPVGGVNIGTFAGVGNRMVIADAAGDLSTQAIPSGADNMGNHTASQNIQLNGRWLTNDGTNNGIRVDNLGRVGIGLEPTGASTFEILSTVPMKINSTNDGAVGNTVNWIAGNFGGTAGDRVVMGMHGGVATIGGHNSTLDAWRDFAINPNSNGNVGIGLLNARGKLHVVASTGTAMMVENTNGVALFASSANNNAASFVGNVDIAGALSKSSGTFQIDHPQDPANKYLYHSFVESPDMMNIYNGNITTDAEGNAVVALPTYFEALNRDFRYQLTVIGGGFAQAIIHKKVANNQFTIKTNQPNIEVSWQVTGIRKDAWANAHRVEPEVEKKTADKGKYLHPELFGQPKEAAIVPQVAKKQPVHK